jgi:uncharacterized protein YecE (DUF72 family)
MLAFYAERLATVEINYSFYRLPGPKAVRAWGEQTPEHFSLPARRAAIRRMSSGSGMRQRASKNFSLGLILWAKGSARFSFRLRHGFCQIQTGLRISSRLYPRSIAMLSFRDQRWFSEDVRKLLTKANCAFCISDLGGVQSPQWITADFAYLRLHGPGAKYQESYSDGELRDWAKLIRSFTHQKIDVYCYFDNDEAGYAPQNALQLLRMVKDDQSGLDNWATFGRQSSTEKDRPYGGPFATVP